ncbi:MAG TPA: type I-MYXAN CRISPR-associated protein Cas5/Cmx5/DevS [Blastocatellia bacterium]|nr:type I-MYXAN CRISPR-associated protein Cas5/Cmx5/DevS [Blastocatellia bacterium]HAF24375.1 type I-MYXAN CRISPR-associated protein Cas5/Cmx5/DevS [Blastocatellia bacterium]
MSVETIRLYVSIPVASFRVPRAREYFETFPVPPPATVYGMLLSMCGEVNRRTHEGAEIAIALLSEPSYSVVLRTMWRVKKKENGLGLGENRRPDFQELLTGVQLAVWVRTGPTERADVPLASRVRTALATPDQVHRFGGLSLGESTHLVDEIKEIGDRVIKGRLLMAQDEGDLSLPIWPDHVGSNTRWGQYRLSDEADITNEVLDNESAWTVIRRPLLALLSSN